MTFLAILIGYVTYSVDEELINGVDELAINHLRRIFGMGNGSHVILKAKQERQRSLESFILALSDQQLITGLAILITGYYKRCEMSGYHFRIAINLAWFSSTTHLSTLAVLNQYLRRRFFLKTMRWTGMFCLMGMLFHAELYNAYYIIPSLPIQCTFEVGFPEIRLKATGVGFFNVTIWFGISFFLIFAYGNNFVRLFASQQPQPTLSILEWIDKHARYSLKLEPSESTMAKFERRINESRGGRKKLKWLWEVAYLCSEFLNSFLWEIIWLLFGNALGITQLYLSRWDNRPDSRPAFFYHNIEGSENSLGFGQITAILLMTLPLLAASEAIYGKDDKLRSSGGWGSSNIPYRYEIEQYEPLSSFESGHSQHRRS